MNKKTNIAVYAMSTLAIMGTTILTPILSTISTSFPNVSETTLKLLITLPATGIMLICLTSAWLVKRFSKKKLILAGILLFGIGGLSGGIAPTFPILLLTRAITGIGIGLIMPLVIAAITDIYKGDESTKMIGISTAICTLGGVVATVVSGLLAKVSWRLPFALYLLAIPVYIITAWGLPDLWKEKVKSNSLKIKIPAKVYFYVIEGFVLSVIGIFFTTNISLYLFAEKIGTSASVGAGAMMAVFFTGAIVTAASFSKIIKKLKNMTIVFLIFAVGLGFFTLFTANIIYIVMLGSLLAGLGFGILNPYLMQKTNKAVSQESNVAAISFISAGMYLGQFLSPLIFGLIGSISGNTSIRFGFMLTAFFCGILLIFTLSVKYIINHYTKRKLVK